MIELKDLKKYIKNKRKRLKKIEKKIKKSRNIYKIFNEKNWFLKVNEQILEWECDPDRAIKVRDITIPEYELFRYFEDNNILRSFLRSYKSIEKVIVSDDEKIEKWNKSKMLLFSQDVSQIYSILFEILVIGKLISAGINTDPYHGNIDGRIKIERRYINLEIKSLQKTQHDLEGVGVGSTIHDKNQIFRALRRKSKQLYPYRNETNLVFLSLYRLTDMTTGEWYVNDFLETKEGLRISAVLIYSWFTANDGKKLIVNQKANHPLSPDEIAVLNKLR